MSRDTFRVKVLTVSDSVSAGAKEERAGPLIAAHLEASGFEIIELGVVAGGVETMAAALRELTRDFAGLVVATDGTGFSPHDLTQEAMMVIEREALV